MKLTHIHESKHLALPECSVKAHNIIFVKKLIYSDKFWPKPKPKQMLMMNNFRTHWKCKACSKVLPNKQVERNAYARTKNQILNDKHQNIYKVATFIRLKIIEIPG